MAHSRLAKDQMFAWIERCLDEGAALPDDAAICDRFNFASPESARTLLSDLADAGRITIRGWGEDRQIAIGRARAASPPSPKPQPSIARFNPDDDRDAERILAIARRGRVNADALLATVAEPAPATPIPAVPDYQEEADVPQETGSKSVTFVAKGAVLEALKKRVEGGEVTYNRAAIDLIEQGLGVAPVPAPAPIAATDEVVPKWIGDLHLDELLEEVRKRFAQSACPADLAAALERAEAAETARQMAETKLATIRAAIG